LNQHRLEVKNEDPAGGGIVTADNNAAISSGDLHVVVTWNESTGELKAYENGIEVISTLTDDAMSDINDVNVWLGRSNYSGDQNLQGEYDEFRIYDHVLSQNEVNGDFQAGPDQLVTAEPVSITIEPSDQTVDEFGTATFSVGVSGLPPISYQWFQGDAELTGETASILTLTSVPFSDNGATFHCVVANSVGGMDYTQTSRSAMLTVNPDMTPPALETARTEDGSSVVVIFSEAILAADGMNTGNFTLEGPVGPVTLTSAEPLSAPGWAQLTPEEPLICGPYTLTVNGVHDVAANANEIAPGSTATFYFLVLGGVRHLYKFDGFPNDSVEGLTVRDSVGSADGVIRGAGAAFSGSRVLLPGGPSTSAAYVDLPNGLLSENSANNGGSGEFTFEAWVKLTGARTWSRIFDFGSSDIGGGVGGEVTGPGGGGAGMDYLFLSAQIGDDTANRRFEVRNEDPAGGGIMTQDYATSGFGKDTHYAVTWKESTGEVDAYEDGVLKASMTVDDQISDIHDVNVWLGRSNWTADQNVQGEYDEVRIYDRALSATDVAANTLVGPENNFGPVGFLNLTVNDFSMNVGDRQPAQVMVDFENVFNVTMTGSPCLSYTTDDPTVITVDANGVLHAVGPGTAMISVRFAGQEEFITVSATVVLTLNIERIENGVRITLTGAVPGRSYTIQRSASVTGPYDMDVSTQTAPADGIIIYEETDPLQESAFFRVVENPALGSPSR
jgi:Concanavalin A-like lectin/glucanases superfamily